MKVDFALWATVAVTQVLVGFLGVLAIKSDFAGQHFKAFVAAFAILSVLGLVASGWGVVRATKSADTIEQLTKDTLYAVQGSPDSYVDIIPNFDKSNGGDKDEGVVTFTIRNESKYPMVDTEVGIGGVRNLDFPKWGYRIGDISPERAKHLPGLKITLRKDAECWVYFSIRSRSVTLWEEIKFQWTGDSWVSDWNLYKEVDGKEVYLREHNKEFPWKHRWKKQPELQQADEQRKEPPDG